MSDYLTSAERAMISGDYDMVFDTMSNGRSIVIVKEPIKALTNLPEVENLVGFGEMQVEPLYDYTPVSGTYPAMIIYPNKHLSSFNPEINARIYAGEVTIKVKKDCRDFMNNGFNKQILLDGKTFLIDGEERRQLFLDAEYFFFDLRASK
jgi:hypothetical protein